MSVLCVGSVCAASCVRCLCVSRQPYGRLYYYFHERGGSGGEVAAVPAVGTNVRLVFMCASLLHLVYACGALSNLAEQPPRAARRKRRPSCRRAVADARPEAALARVEVRGLSTRARR